MTKPTNIQSIEQATGKPWEYWTKIIDDWGGRQMTHPQIAERVHKELQGSIESAGWWAQGVTVAYEQHIGRRVPGQRSDGTFEFSISRTIDGSRAHVYDGLLNKMEGRGDFRGMAVRNVRTSVTPVRSYWKCDFADGSKLSCAVEARGEDKSALVITHAGLQDESSRDLWRVYWKDFITGI